MLGILFLYFIGKQFYDLAKKYNKSEWGYSLLGIIKYYVGTFLGGIVIGLTSYYFDFSLEGISDLMFGFMAIPFGLLMTWLTYLLLKKNFTNSPSSINVLDDTILDEEL